MIKAGNRFFLPFSSEINQEIALPEEEAYHLVKVLRKKEKEKILIIDGKGKEYEAQIEKIKHKGKKVEAIVYILKITREEKLFTPQITILMPLLKGEKKDFLLEKLIELGADEIMPYISKFTETKIKENLLNRFQKKAISSLKQSGRLWLPLIHYPQPLDLLLNQIPKSDSIFFWGSEKGKYICIKEVLNKKHYKKIVLISGPEGGFDKQEEELLKKYFIPVKLSPYILRAETACIALLTIFSYHIFELKKLAKK